MKEVEQHLRELEGKYSDLSHSYEALQNEYLSLKQELEKLSLDDKRSEYSAGGQSLGGLSYDGSYQLPKEADFDCSLFDESLFNFETDPVEVVGSTSH